MNGYQITFFTRQDRRHKGKQIGEWLIQLVQELGLRSTRACMPEAKASPVAAASIRRIFSSLPTSLSKF